VLHSKLEELDPGQQKEKQKANLRNCIEGMWRPLLTPGYMPAVVIAGTPADFACLWKPFALQE